MDKILQDRLFNDFPKIFGEKDLPMQQTCMCWGIDCDDGWFGLLHKLCSYLQWHTDRNKFPQVIANQVKEKYGTLRFYYTLDCRENTYSLDLREDVGKDSELLRRCSEHDGAIQFAESMSARICEVCGQFDDSVEMKVKGGWYKTLCSVCTDQLRYDRIHVKEDEV